MKAPHTSSYFMCEVAVEAIFIKKYLYASELIGERIMSDINHFSSTIYLTIDCEFTEEGLVRELVLLLYKNNQIVRALEVLISPSGAENIHYNHQQINYHLANPKPLTACINSFMESCFIYAPIDSIKLVGMSLEHDLKSLLNTTKKKSLLNAISQKTQLEMCGRGTLENKAQSHQVSPTQITRIIDKLVTPKHRPYYKYHTALYDAIVTGYVYLRVTGHTGLMGVHDRFKKCTHTYFKSYYEDLSKLSNNKKQTVKTLSPAPNKVPKNFPEIRYRVQKKISNVFDIVAREMFYQQLTRLHYEPSLKKIDQLKVSIMQQIHPVKLAVAAYDTPKPVTDPYNTSLVHAGILLVNKKIKIEDFIDFAIYMQQYNLPKDKGTYYKVWDSKKEIFVRCLQISTAKKLLYKRPYCTMEQFLRKKPAECFIETLE